MADMQNGGLPPAASRNQLVRWLPKSHSAQAQQMQLLTGRYRMSASLARDLAYLYFGEVAND